MSSKVMMICDRCGKEFSENEEHANIYMYDNNYKKSESLTDSKHYDLCMNCVLGFASFMAGPSIAEARKQDPFWITDEHAKNIIKELYLY